MSQTFSIEDNKFYIILLVLAFQKVLQTVQSILYDIFMTHSCKPVSLTDYIFILIYYASAHICLQNPYSIFVL